MKKFRLILTLLTAVSGIYMIYANWSVRGYHLLQMNSGSGYRVAVTYRWSVVIFLVMVAVRIAAEVLIRRRQAGKYVCPACGARCGEQDKFCKSCGKPFLKK